MKTANSGVFATDHTSVKNFVAIYSQQTKRDFNNQQSTRACPIKKHAALLQHAFIVNIASLNKLSYR